jgi:hypothetical protein
MQQMNSEEASHSWQNPYGSYTGSAEYGNSFAGAAEQKLHVNDDEIFATLLAQKIKEELRGELQPASNSFPGMRLALAIVSLCLLVPLFGLLILAITIGHVSGDGSHALGWGTIAICATIIAVNGYFNWASGGMKKQDDRATQKSHEQVKHRKQLKHQTH